ncbi:hypothetical protein LTR10_019763 [Elasticomyces elasticus]|uniref:Quinate repressor protein n=1 Tax=Exophiala sideris TaxID=1016849 RepID=A0ABR0JCK0_9EURO|nr:hypothetical protein LTR10_019763 [Elasticomyces elasticus]KAK5032110.1 hypothetical protein LTS07_004732 [Exophiala sideris]KAK5041037.1 hypothetical protein LTR13_003339 [Exophiala sideris]KAK5061629.1 hypothetical protein LTR69_004811 [Exophiala sideris]KAK5184328.1 hypothetical protein LTR44_003001 [Eurotiomycetes sp. CCFEE 6388]
MSLTSCDNPPAAVRMKRQKHVEDDVEDLEASVLARCHLPKRAVRSWPNEDGRVSRRRFPPHTSIVIIGPRGAGKSSLAVIAGAMLNYQVIDDDDFFLKVTGLSKQKHRKEYGREAYRLQELECMRAMLSQHTNRTVMTCGQGAITAKGTALLRSYGQNHPVIYATRESDILREYFPAATLENCQSFLLRVHSAWRRASNFEFFNLSERWGEAEPSSTEGRLQRMLPNRTFRQRSMQTLQNTKSLLARFLLVVLGNVSSKLWETSFQTLLPPQPEERPFSQILRLPLRALENDKFILAGIDPCVDAVELSIDQSAYDSMQLQLHCSVEWAVAVLRRHFNVPICFHVDISPGLEIEPGAKDWDRYFDLIETGFRLALEYVTIDLRADASAIERLIDIRGHTKVIGVLHTPEPRRGRWRSNDPMQDYERGKTLGCDIIRLSQPCLTIEDNFECQQFRSDVSAMSDGIPLSAFNTKALGLLSRVFNWSLTPITSPAVLHASIPALTADAGDSSSTLRRNLFTLNVLDPLQFFVFGAEVDFSLSPAMHNAGFAAGNMSHSYRIWQTNKLEEVKETILSGQFGGASISMPFKTEIVSMVQQLSPSARVIGAANTLLPVRDNVSWHPKCADQRCKCQRNRSGPVVSLLGDNTDWMGIYACIAKYTSPANNITSETSALVIGAGGLSRAGIYTLVKLGIRNIFIYNRTVSKARALAQEYMNAEWSFEEVVNIQYETREQQNVSGLQIKVLESTEDRWPTEFSFPSIILSTIPAHRNPKSPSVDLQLPDGWLKHPTGGLIVELAYHSRETLLAAQFRKMKYPGWTLIDPVEVLFEQACFQFELFTGCKAPREAMWEAGLEQYAQQMEPKF